MIRLLRRFSGCSTGTAAVEAAIFLPIFLLFTLGVTDLGSEIFVRMTVNAAAQAGASYAVVHGLSGIDTAMNDAADNSSFCTATAQNPSPCTASFTSCADANGGTCYTVSASYQLSPILPEILYSWAQSHTVSSTVIVRVQ